jgi:hypothetical protein
MQLLGWMGRMRHDCRRDRGWNTPATRHAVLADKWGTHAGRTGCSDARQIPRQHQSARPQLSAALSAKFGKTSVLAQARRKPPRPFPRLGICPQADMPDEALCPNLHIGRGSDRDGPAMILLVNHGAGFFAFSAIRPIVTVVQLMFSTKTTLGKRNLSTPRIMDTRLDLRCHKASPTGQSHAAMGLALAQALREAQLGSHSERCRVNVPHALRISVSEMIPIRARGLLLGVKPLKNRNGSQPVCAR